MTLVDFVPFPKMARLRRDCIITEKIDGTNASVLITDSGDVFAGSRNRFVYPNDDNYGFAKRTEVGQVSANKKRHGERHHRGV